MKKLLTELKYMLTSDDSDKLSSKRVVTLSAFMLVAIGYLANIIFGYAVDENMFNGIIQTVWAGLGVTVGEHLLKKRNNTSENKS